MQTYEEYLTCDGNYDVKSAFSKDKMINLHPTLRRNRSRKHNRSRARVSSRKRR